ncbi:hypothetical protein [Streptomyces brasiliensis]|uniref:DUF1508 domain-containing protein n=1 Tax=Streptomyces brasiliensis TaxID=1954 RepID=A0A917KIK3_9ACTN|nr:hypothetical protein [Streptomyces brasiliensis]GGJ12731.1 hypothetical protein GCM10010121_023940 [Streptomyces brasiliensis]
MVPSRFLYVVRGAGQRPGRGEQAVGWRLVGSNHRELGRSAESFDGFAECRAAVLRLRERIADAKALLSTTESAGGWSWRLEIDGRAAAVAGRPYQRQRDCQYNLGQFLNAVPVADLAEPTPARPREAGGTRPHGTGRAADRPEPGLAARPQPGPASRPAPGIASRSIPPGPPKSRPDLAGRPAPADGDGVGGARDHAGTGAR